MRPSFFAFVLAAVGALAAPLELEKRAVTTLTATQVAAFTPYTYYAAASYCTPATTKTWSCGANCNANAGFKPVASGGDGALTQYWYVGYDPVLKTVIVGHQGTDSDKILPVITDAAFFLTTPDSSLFPGLPSGVQMHNGFLSTHSRSAPAVLAAVKTAMSTYGATSVTTVGHSLGAAISLLDAVYLPKHLPSTTTFKTVVYGLPRVGNPEFANYVDSAASKVKITHISNREDPVPILPGRFLGFKHPSGEVHIDKETAVWSSCSGQDNTDGLCNVGDTTNIFDATPSDHSGPYGVVARIGC